MNYEVLELLKILLERRYGSLEDDRGCYVNGKWLSVSAIVELIDRVDENAVED